MPYQKNKNFYRLLQKVDACLKTGMPFSIYRKPLENKVKGVFQSGDKLKTAINFEEKGFVFAPFDDNGAIVLIKADELAEVDFLPETKNIYTEVELKDSGKDFHIELIKKGLNEIKEGSLKKVVLSRKISRPVSSSPSLIFKNLLERYQNAFCYLFFHPQIGVWCGATPETLVQIKDRQLRTMALAATLPIKESSSPGWGSKEFEEQAMVTRYIKETLGSSLDSIDIGELESVKAGKLWHLKSTISGILSEKTSIKQVIDSLHPTPAVCGIPSKEAKSFIKNNEGYERTFYTGFLGELDLEKKRNIDLFVNLRCMKICDGMASIFVGGGITSASEPESEWTETQNKSKTMLSII